MLGYLTLAVSPAKVKLGSSMHAKKYWRILIWQFLVSAVELPSLILCQTFPAMLNPELCNHFREDCARLSHCHDFASFHGNKNRDFTLFSIDFFFRRRAWPLRLSLRGAAFGTCMCVCSIQDI